MRFGAAGAVHELRDLFLPAGRHGRVRVHRNNLCRALFSQR